MPRPTFRPSRLGQQIVRALLMAGALAAAPAARAQTDYFWNAPTGGTGTWDTSTVTWSTTSAGPVSYTWLNNGSERANFGNTAGTVTIAPGGVNVYGINFTAANYNITGDTLTLSGAGGVINSSVAATISTSIAGTVGLMKIGTGTLTLSGANTYTGGTTVSGGSLVGIAQASGSPFGAATGSVTLSYAALRLNGVDANTTTSVGDFTVTAATANGTGAASLVIDNTAGSGGGFSTILAAGNLLRGGVGSALVITPVLGTLGTGEQVSFANGGALLTNGILPAWVVATAGGANPAADFLTHGVTGGAVVASYSSTDLTTASSSSVVNQTSAVTAATPVQAYALRTAAAIDLGGNTLTLGNGTGTTGLILNGGSVTNGNMSFGATEGLVYVQGTATLGSAGKSISSNGLTVTALGPVNLSLAGNITDGAQPARLIVTGVTSGTSVTLSGANTYTGGSTISVNTGTTGHIFVGSDTAFGTGKVTNIIVPGSSSPLLEAQGGTRTLANAFDLNGGLTFTGTNSLVFTGPITIINSASGGTRTLANSVTGGATVTFGSSVTPSTITLGNPVANGGDGVGKVLILGPGGSTTFVINDVLQDPASGGGAASGTVLLGGSTGGVMVINSQSTYTGVTTFNGLSTIQFTTSSNAGGTAGPFGAGTILMNNTNNNFIQPIGGNRTVANPITMNFGFQVTNATGDTSGVTFTGPIAMLAAGRTITNNFTAGTGGVLTLGAAVSPSTLTLPTTTPGLILTITGPGTTVINDTIQDAPGVAGAITVAGAGSVTFNGPINSNGPMTLSGTGTVAFNSLRTGAGGTTLSGAGTIIRIGISSNALPGASFTAGPFGTGTINVNNGTNQHLRPTGGDRLISNPITLTTGVAMDNAIGESFNLTLAGPITMTNNRFITNGFIAGSTGGAFIIGSPTAPSTITLPTTTSFQLSFAALAGPIVVNNVMRNAAGQTDLVVINPNTNNSNPVILNGANTYTGTTTIGSSNANSGGSVLLGVSSVGNPGSITSGPFGTNTVIMSMTGTGNFPTLQPLGADRTVANAITLASGFFASSASTTGTGPAVDPTGPHNLTLSGSIALGGTSRALTNNMASGVGLTLGLSGSPSTLSLGTASGLQLTLAGTGTTVINNLVQDGTGGNGGLIVSGGTVWLNNANTYTGDTMVSGGRLLVANASGSGTGTGAVTVQGTGAVGSGGALGGTRITGLITISTSPAGPTSGGIVSPGLSVGTLVVGSMTWNPLGQYTFEYDAGNNATGGTANDFINGSGSLDLSSLTADNRFTLNLVPVTSPATTTQQAYTVATFAQGITGADGPFANGADVSGLFTLGGTFASAPASFATVVGATGGPQSLVITFTPTPTPVPEPGCVLALCAAVAGAAGWCRARRNQRSRPE